jgi:hypothetical protein
MWLEPFTWILWILSCCIYCAIYVLVILSQNSKRNAGFAEQERFDPMGEESLLMPHLSAGYPTKEQRILSMLEGATGWSPVQSPRREDNLTGVNLMELLNHEHGQVCISESAFQSPNTGLVDGLNSVGVETPLHTLSPTLPAPQSVPQAEGAPTLDHNMTCTLNSSHFFAPSNIVTNTQAAERDHAPPEVITHPSEESPHPTHINNTPNHHTDDRTVLSMVDLPTDHCTPAAALASDTEQGDVDDLQRFLDFVSGAADAPILNTPPRPNQPAANPTPLAKPTNPKQRKSARLADKAKSNVGLGSVQLAQQVLIKKFGELIPESQGK